MAQAQAHASAVEPEEELSEVSLEDTSVDQAANATERIPSAKAPAETTDDKLSGAAAIDSNMDAKDDKASDSGSRGLSSKAGTIVAAPEENIPNSESRRPSLTIPSPGISVSPAVAAHPPISPSLQALKQMQEALDASTAPSPPTTSTALGPAVIPAFPAAATDASSPGTAAIHPPTDADRFGYPAPGSLMTAGQAPPVIAVQEMLGEEDGVLKFGKPVAPGGGLAPEVASESTSQEPDEVDSDSLSGSFDKVDLSDESGYQKGLAMLEQGKMPTPDMMSPQEWLAFQQQRSSGLGKKHPSAQPGSGKDQQEGGWFQSMTPYAKEMGRTFGRLASTVEHQLSVAYKRGERRRDRALAMLESAQQAAAQSAAITPEVFEAFWRKLFSAPPEEELEIAYACSLNTEAGPVPGVIYQSNRSLAFCSDKPVAYPTVDGHSEQAAYKLIIPWVEVTGIQGLRSQPLVQERYVRVAIANGDELWFLRFKDYKRGLTGMQSGLHDFAAGTSEPSPSTEPAASKPESKPGSRSATPPLPTPKTTRSDSRGRERAPGEEENLQETYTAKVHEAIEKARISSAENLASLGRPKDATATEPPVRNGAPASQRKTESTGDRGKADDRQTGASKGSSEAGVKSGVPVEKPGAGDILDVGRKEEVKLPEVAVEPPVKAAGAGDVLDAGAREEVSLPPAGSAENGSEELEDGLKNENEVAEAAGDGGMQTAEGLR